MDTARGRSLPNKVPGRNDRPRNGYAANQQWNRQQKPYLQRNTEPKEFSGQKNPTNWSAQAAGTKEESTQLGHQSSTESDGNKSTQEQNSSWPPNPWQVRRPASAVSSMAQHEEQIKSDEMLAFKLQYEEEKIATYQQQLAGYKKKNKWRSPNQFVTEEFPALAPPRGRSEPPQNSGPLDFPPLVQNTEMAQSNGPPVRQTYNQAASQQVCDEVPSTGMDGAGDVSPDLPAGDSSGPESPEPSASPPAEEMEETPCGEPENYNIPQRDTDGQQFSPDVPSNGPRSSEFDFCIGSEESSSPEKNELSNFGGHGREIRREIWSAPVEDATYNRAQQLAANRVVVPPAGAVGLLCEHSSFVVTMVERNDRIAKDLKEQWGKLGTLGMQLEESTRVLEGLSSMNSSALQQKLVASLDNAYAVMNGGVSACHALLLQKCPHLLVASQSSPVMMPQPAASGMIRAPTTSQKTPLMNIFSLGMSVVHKYCVLQQMVSVDILALTRITSELEHMRLQIERYLQQQQPGDDVMKIALEDSHHLCLMALNKAHVLAHRR